MAAIEWNKVCCPVDFSEPARTALRVAADLCRRLGSELVLLHADGAGKLADELLPAKPVEVQLTAWKEEAQRLGAPRVTVARAAGQPEVAIAEFAKKNGVNLIVMGTHGRMDREHMLTGSVAEGVVRKAECPVLSVHPKWMA
jgi:nucleotide-binding universal stress UspA family protein